MKMLTNKLDYFLLIIKKSDLFNFSKGDCIKLLKPYEVISFDIFDTLVRRKIHDPELVKVPVAKYISSLLSEREDIHIPLEQISDLRYNVESKLRTTSVEKGLDPECNYPDIIRGIYKSFNVDEKRVTGYTTETVEYELNIEKRLIELMPGAIDTLTKLKDANKTVIATSDMYLAKEQICEILSMLGILPLIDNFYLSSEILLNKGTGRLFQFILENNNYKDMIHIGDNFYSDYISPLNTGLNAYYYFDYKEYLRKRKISHLFDGEMQYTSPKRILKFAELWYKEKTYYYSQGIKILGPLYLLFVLGVMEKIQELNIEKVFFVARDGYIPMKIYNLLKCNLCRFHDLPASRYIYLSRKSTILPSIIDRFGPRELDLGLLKHNQKGISPILETYGLDSNKYEDIFKKQDIDAHNTPIWSKYDKKRVLNAFQSNEFKKIVNPQIQLEAKLLYNYLESIDFLGRKKIALVDVGWGGSIIDNLDRAFGRLPEYPDVYALYLGLVKRKQIKEDKYNLSKKMGIVYDYRHEDNQEYYILEFYDLIEEIARKCEGSAIGYKLNLNGKITPVLKDYKLSTQDYILKEIQRGIISYIDTYINLEWFLKDQHFSDIKEEYNKYLSNKIYFPAIRDIRAFENIFHDEDIGSAYRYTPVKILRIKDLLSLRELRNKYNLSTWKPATLAKIPLANYFYYSRKRRKKLTDLGGI
jgi:predicted HAD superfamily hydrolase